MANTQDTNIILDKRSVQDAIALAESPLRGQFLNNFKQVNYQNGKSIYLPSARLQGSGGLTTPITAEGTNVPAPIKQLAYEGTKLTPKRFAEIIELSEEANNNGAEENIKMARELGLQRILYGIEFKATGGGDTIPDGTSLEQKGQYFEKLITAPHATATTKQGESLAYKDVLKAYNNLAARGKLNGAFWLIDAELSVYDEYGNQYLKRDNVPVGAHGTLFDLPVFKTQVFDGTEVHAFTLVHPNAYAMTMSDVIVKKADLDTNQAIAGKQVFVVEVWADGKGLDKYCKYSMKYAPSV